MKNRLLNILIALDQMLYVLISFGHGSPDETMSSAAWRMERDGKIAGRLFRPLIDRLFLPLTGRHHCFSSYMSEAYRTQLPREFRVGPPR